MSCVWLQHHIKALSSSRINHYGPIRLIIPILRHKKCYATLPHPSSRYAHPPLWHSIIPKFLRRPKTPALSKQSISSKEWNPATFFIVIFLLIGSNAIQMITLRNEFSNFNRKSDAKIALLKDVIERIQKGEEVDVAGILGTGDPEQEREWEGVLRELQEIDCLWESKNRHRKKRKASNDVGEAATEIAPERPGVPIENIEGSDEVAVEAARDRVSPAPPRGFY